MTIHWTKTRKIAVLKDLEAGTETLETLNTKHNISPAEIEEWRSNLDKHGVGGLRVTHASRYRRRK